MNNTQKFFNDFEDSISIGPLVGLPSSVWVGEDIANYLIKQTLKIEKFNDFNTKINTQYIIVVKLMPSINWLLEKVKAGVKVLYVPVDIFHSPYVYWQYKAHLKLFSGFLIHNDGVGELVEKASEAPQFHIEHYLKYEVNRDVKKDKQQELLWVGHLEYIPSFLKFMEEHKPKIRIRALSDLEKLSSYDNYLKNSLVEMGYKYSLKRQSDGTVFISGILIEQWSEKKQKEAMEQCLGAFDTKMDSFAHNLKPPTKAQKFVYNKVPFACSEYSFSYKYFRRLGLKLVTLSELDRLVSDEYLLEINDFCEQEMCRVKIDNVAASYLDACQKSVLPKPYSFDYFHIMNIVYHLAYLYSRIVGKLTTVFRQIKLKE